MLSRVAVRPIASETARVRRAPPPALAARTSAAVRRRSYQTPAGRREYWAGAAKERDSEIRTKRDAAPPLRACDRCSACVSPSVLPRPSLDYYTYGASKRGSTARGASTKSECRRFLMARCSHNGPGGVHRGPRPAGVPLDAGPAPGDGTGPSGRARMRGEMLVHRAHRAPSGRERGVGAVGLGARV